MEEGRNQNRILLFYYLLLLLAGCHALVLSLRRIPARILFVYESGCVCVCVWAEANQKIACSQRKSIESRPQRKMSSLGALRM